MCSFKSFAHNFTICSPITFLVHIFYNFFTRFEFSIKVWVFWDIYEYVRRNMGRLLSAFMAICDYLHNLWWERPHKCTWDHTFWEIRPMRPKARGLAQHGGLPVWLEESNPAGVILYAMDGRTACQELSSCELMEFQLMIHSKCTQPSAMSYVTRGSHGLVL